MNTLLKSLAVLLIISAVFATSVDRRRHTRHHLRSKTKNDQWLLIFDGGSSKTNVQLFNGAAMIDGCSLANEDKDGRLGKVLESKNVDAYAANLVKLVEDLAKKPGCENADKFEAAWLQSTAGSRVTINALEGKGEKPLDTLAAISTKATELLKAKFTNFKSDFVAEVITGRFEGVYGWYAAWATTGIFTDENDSQNYVYMEIGGASLQVVFRNEGCTGSPVPVKSRRFYKKARKGDVNINGKKLWSFSFLGLGANELIKAVNHGTGKETASYCLAVNEDHDEDGVIHKGVDATSGNERYNLCLNEINTVFSGKDTDGFTYQSQFDFINAAVSLCTAPKKTKVIWNGATSFAFKPKTAVKFDWAGAQQTTKDDKCKETYVKANRNDKACFGAVIVDAFKAKVTSLSTATWELIKVDWTPGAAKLWAEKSDHKVMGIDKYAKSYHATEDPAVDLDTKRRRQHRRRH